MRTKYDDESVMSTLNISCCLDPRFMLKYYDDDDEAMATHQGIIQQGIVIARQMEEQQPPCPSASGENEGQEESTDDVSAALAKKRRLVDILSTTNLPQEAMSIEECVKEELSHYLGYNQPEINSSPLKWWKCHNKDIFYISVLAKKYLSMCNQLPFREGVQYQWKYCYRQAQLSKA